MKRLAAAIIGTAGLTLLVACGGSNPSPIGVAALPSQSAAAPAEPGPTASPDSSDEIAQAVAYAQCMRTHGVPGWPDPDGSGVFDKSQVKRAVPNRTPQVDAAESACEDLLPTSMRAPTPAQVQQTWTDMVHFAQCMRDHGVANAPDPTTDPRHPDHPFFDLTGTGIDVHSPQLMATAQECLSLLHLSTLPQVSGGGS